MPKINSPGYLPQLDSLRAAAVLLVIVSHWLPATHILNKYLPTGIFGVTLFFVLSGYLITGILLKNKEMLYKGLTVKEAVTVFYIRRSLRIFPVYYLFIILLLIYYPSDISPSLYWHVFYVSNFYFYFQNGFSAQLSHLWSLAVEEQFYLVWPAIILLCRRCRLPAIFVGGIFTAIIFRVMMYDPPLHLGRLLMPGSLDSFCIGALLAYGQLYKPTWYNKIRSHQHFLLLTLFVLIVLLHIGLQFYYSDFLVLAFYYFVLSVFFFVVIMVVAATSDNAAFSRFILYNPVFIYIGKISYGLYVYHLIIPNFKEVHFPVMLVPYSIEIIFIIRFLALIIIASASYWFFEKPILKFKRNFNNQPAIAARMTELINPVPVKPEIE